MVSDESAELVITTELADPITGRIGRDRLSGRSSGGMISSSSRCGSRMPRRSARSARDARPTPVPRSWRGERAGRPTCRDGRCASCRIAIRCCASKAAGDVPLRGPLRIARRPWRARSDRRDADSRSAAAHARRRASVARAVGVADAHPGSETRFAVRQRRRSSRITAAPPGRGSIIRIRSSRRFR